MGKYSHGVAGVLPAALKAVKGAGGIENFITGLGNILGCGFIQMRGL